MSSISKIGFFTLLALIVNTTNFSTGCSGPIAYVQPERRLAGMGPPVAPAVAPDHEIETALTRWFFVDPLLAAQPLSVRVLNGIVTLSGVSSNLRARARAVQVAQYIQGVRSVVNLVDLTAADVVTSQLRQAAVQAVTGDPAAQGYPLQITVLPGKVILAGTVYSQTAFLNIAWLAGSIPGVRKVENKIQVQSPAIRPDSQIAADIMCSIRREPRLDANLIQVTVTQGNVAFAGIVGGVAEKELLAQQAATTGVKLVSVMDVVAQPTGREKFVRYFENEAPSDQMIREAVRAALAQDPRIPGNSVRVGVAENTATLKGRGLSRKIQLAALDDPGNTLGVAKTESTFSR